MVSSPISGAWRSMSHPETTKRAFDFAVASIALVLASPVMLLLALAIVCESGRPVFFSQTRLGLGGRPFRMYKFRKFNKSCGASGSPLTLNKDQRLTRVGRFLLATKMDELPQFWNVLKGDMSIIGPRPESMAFADCFSGRFERVLDYKPGILGPAQAVFRSECMLYPPCVDPAVFYRAVLFPAKAQIDLDYYRRRTLASDVAWIMKSAFAVLGLSGVWRVNSPQLADCDEAIRCEIETFERTRTARKYTK
ncbi:MAG TPA: sugar transferase [Microvirga sp.]|nr:sugar transferase [Microvirga sp.]